MNIFLYVLSGVFLLLCLLFIYLSYIYDKKRYTEREINLYDSFWKRLWFRHRVSFSIGFALMFGLFAIAGFTTIPLLK